MRALSRSFWIGATAISALLAAAAHADDPCAGFTWNVAHERALFAATAQALNAGRSAATAPAAEIDRFYELVLAPNEQVQLPAPNRKAHGAGTGFAGLVRLQVSQAGSYRISVGSQMWVDLASGSMLIGSSDFAGQHGCDAPHKIVQYDLQPGTFVLQLSGGSGDHVRVAVTRVPRDQ
ncbi:MAG TPA: hypothetical protein VET66_00205 [Steroidobacteraceae bacterium]|nr:hypothetical protein [Steroidobacteraceae bacterium]